MPSYYERWEFVSEMPFLKKMHVCCLILNTMYVNPMSKWLQMIEMLKARNYQFEVMSNFSVS